MHEILGTSPFAPVVFGNAAPDSGNSEILALAGTEDQKQQWLTRCWPATCVGVLDDRAAHRGLDPTLLETAAVLEGDQWVINGHKWFSNASVADFLIVMAVTDPEAHRTSASMFIVPVDAPGVRILRDIPTMEHPYEHYGRYGGHSEIVYEDVRRARRRAARRARRRLPDRPAAARPGPHPPLHALAGRLQAGVRHALRARRQPPRPRLRAGRQADRAELGRRLGGADARRRG